MEPTKSQLIYKNACLSEGIEKLQIENEELRVQNEALGLKIKHIKEAMGDLDFYYKAKLAEKEKEINKLKELVKTIDSYNQYSDKAENFIILDPKNYYLDGHKLIIKTDKQDKISFAVEQLEKVKEFIFEQDIEITRLNKICDFLYQQIKQIKEGK